MVVGVDGEIGVLGSGGGATMGIALDMRAGAVGLDGVVVGLQYQSLDLQNEIGSTCTYTLCSG